QPAALYGITKVAAEQAGLRLGALHQLDVRVVRLGPIYGPWEYATKVRDNMSPHKQIVDAALAGKAVILPRKMTADWLSSRDAANGIAGLLQAGNLHHSLYNLGGGTLSDLTQWCEPMAPHAQAGFSWKLAEDSDTPNIIYGLERDRAALDISRLASDAHFIHAYDIARAAPDYLTWVNDHPSFQLEP